MPEFDPNEFATPIDEKKYAKLLNDKLNPLYDRAIGAASPTGSTFKMVTGSGAISSGVIKPNQVLYDSGAWMCHGVLFRDIAAGGLGSVGFVRALAASSDGYFYQLGFRLGHEALMSGAWMCDGVLFRDIAAGGLGSVGFVRALAASSDGYFYQLGFRLGHERLRYYATQYGLGSRMQVDLPGEFPGNWPTEEWTQKNYHVRLEPSDVCQLAIGQGAMQATPLQMANVTATVVNGGTVY